MGVARDVVRRRIDPSGTKEITVVTEGGNRILVEVPGVEDPEALKKLIGQTARLEFKLVDLSANPQDVQQGRAPPGSQVAADGRRQRPHRGQAPGDGLGRPDRRRPTRASTRTAGRTSRSPSTPPARAASAERPRRMSASRSRSSSTTRSCRRRPSTSRSSAATRRSPAASPSRAPTTSPSRLASGKLPVKLNVIEERTVSAELGQDSIHKGAIASIVSVRRRDHLHARHLRPLRRLCDDRAGRERVPDPRHHGDVQRDADASGNRRLHPHHRRRGRRQRADQRANTRGDKARAAAASTRSRPAIRKRSARFSTPTSRTSSRPRSWPISAPARCAASPSCS